MLCSVPLGQSRSLHKLPASACFGLLLLPAPRKVAAPAPIPSNNPQSILISLVRGRIPPCCANPDFEPTEVEGVANDGSGESVVGDGVFVRMTNTGMNSRRIFLRIGIDVALDVIWGILTDYERLAEFIPGLAVSELLEKRDNFARLYQVLADDGCGDVVRDPQCVERVERFDDRGMHSSYLPSCSSQIGEQNLAFGLKFGAKGIVDCFEKDLESTPSGKKRDIEFKMVEGDFEVFEGRWSIEQNDGREYGDIEPLKGEGDYFRTTLSYVVDVKPKLWLPVRLVEGRLCKEIQTNLLSIREEARKATRNPLPS